MRVIGLDLGTKRIGVAVSDESLTIAQPKELIERRSNAYVIERLMSLVAEYHGDVEKMIVGYPVNMNGTKGERARDAEMFSVVLRKGTGLPVELWDERMTTAEAEDVMIEADMSRAKRRKKIDSMAAQLILQSYLDKRGT
jgi:putative Holliday junction resolvase